MFSWSYSAINDYITCPRKYHAVRVEKRFQRSETEATKWGTEVHEAIERKIKEGAPLPERMKQFNPVVDGILKFSGEVYSEQELAITVDHNPCTFSDPTVWARGIVDFLGIKGDTALDVDWKTGNRREGSSQLKMSAGLVFANFPQVNKVVTGYVWLKEGGISKDVYIRSEYGSIWKSFDKDLNDLEWSFENNSWPAKPSGLCKKYCEVSDCQFNGGYKR